MKKFIGLLTLIITIISCELQGQQVQKQVINSLITTPFNSRHINSSILNTSTFKKPNSFKERVILLINQDLYLALKDEIYCLIQDMFDEGIDVWPFLIAHTQFLADSGQWRLDAGLWLNEFIGDAYLHSRMTNISEREKRGLVILGAFPAVFVNWHEKTDWPTPSIPAWWDIKVVNGNDYYKDAVIHVSWDPYPKGTCNGYALKAYHVKNPEEIDETKIERDDITEKFEFLIDNKRVEIKNEEKILWLSSKRNKCIAKPPLVGHKNFQFELQALLPNNNMSDPAWSPIINWNFLINPSDYVLADINGFSNVVDRAYPYRPGQEKKEDFGMRANPVLVVTDGVKTNSKKYELSLAEIGSKRKYAEAEMYYGRIDAFSLTGIWESQSIGDDITDNRKRVVGDEYVEEEIRMIREYLERNHLWRKRKNIRDSYNGIYFFRSSDFVGKVDEKTNAAHEWRTNKRIKFVDMDDAKKTSGCNEGIKPLPIVTLHRQINFKGKNPITVEKENKDLSLSPILSLEINRRGLHGGVVLFSKKDFEGDVEIITADVNDLRKNKTVKNPASLKLLNCYELNSPSWDCKDHLFNKLKRRLRLVDLGAHGSTYGFTLSDGVVNSMKGTRSWDDRAVSDEDIWNLGGDIKFLINHSCHNNQFMAPGNAGSAFLFRNKILAEWGWSGSGTVEHQILHEKLSAGERFGTATMKNFDAQMSAKDSNPWRSYLTVVLGDPTLRVIYDLPDLTVSKIELPSRAQSYSRYSPITVFLKNDGAKRIPKNSNIHCSWCIVTKKGKKVNEGTFDFRWGLEPGQEKIEELTFKQRLLPGGYVFQVYLDDGNLIEEINENNNDGKVEFNIMKEIFTEKVPLSSMPGGIKIGLKGRFTLTKTEFPIFTGGEENIIFDEEIPVDTDYKTSWTKTYSGGISMEAGMGHSLSIESGFYYNLLSTTSIHPDWPHDYDKTSFHTLAVPLILKLNFGTRKSFFIGGGVEGAIVLSVLNHNHSVWNGETSDIIVTKIGGKKIASLLNSGLIGSTRVTAGVSLGPLTIEAGYFQGINELFLKLSSHGGERVQIGRFKGLILQTGLTF